MGSPTADDIANFDANLEEAHTPIATSVPSVPMTARRASSRHKSNNLEYWNTKSGSRPSATRTPTSTDSKTSKRAKGTACDISIPSTVLEARSSQEKEHLSETKRNLGNMYLGNNFQ